MHMEKEKMYEREVGKLLPATMLRPVSSHNTELISVVTVTHLWKLHVPGTEYR